MTSYTDAFLIGLGSALMVVLIGFGYSLAKEFFNW